MTAPRCPRCGGSRSKPRHVIPPGATPWLFGPGVQPPLCGHDFHR